MKAKFSQVLVTLCFVASGIALVGTAHGAGKARKASNPEKDKLGMSLGAIPTGSNILVKKDLVFDPADQTKWLSDTFILPYHEGNPMFAEDSTWDRWMEMNHDFLQFGDRKAIFKECGMNISPGSALTEKRVVSAGTQLTITKRRILPKLAAQKFMRTENGPYYSNWYAILADIGVDSNHLRELNLEGLAFTCVNPSTGIVWSDGNQLNDSGPSSPDTPTVDDFNTQFKGVLELRIPSGS